MRAIVRSALFLLAAGAVHADPHDDVIEVFATMANALTTANPVEFMRPIDPQMEGYGQLKTDVAALVNQADITSSIEPLQDAGNATTWMIDLDWLLEVRSLVQDGPVVRRREIVHCLLEKTKGRWKIVAMKPLEFFAPPPLDR
jgi:hypothetical protein